MLSHQVWLLCVLPSFSAALVESERVRGEENRRSREVGGMVGPHRRHFIVTPEILLAAKPSCGSR